MAGRTTVDEKHMSSPRDFTQHFFLTVFSRVTHGGLSERRTTRSLNKFYMLRLLNISLVSHSKSFWKLSWMTLLSVWSLYYWQNVCIRSNLSCLRTPQGRSEVAELDRQVAVLERRQYHSISFCDWFSCIFSRFCWEQATLSRKYNKFSYLWKTFSIVTPWKQ